MPYLTPKRPGAGAWKLLTSIVHYLPYLNHQLVLSCPYDVRGFTMRRAMLHVSLSLAPPVQRVGHVPATPLKPLISLRLSRLSHAWDSNNRPGRRIQALLYSTEIGRWDLHHDPTTFQTPALPREDQLWLMER